jgi:predicted negative regulator of RcsB-dependent stress response
VIATARQLTDALNGMAARLAEVQQDSEKRDQALAEAAEDRVRYERRSRKLVVVDIALTALLGFVGWQAHDASDSAAQTNAASAENEQLWNYVLTLFAPRPDETAAEKAAGRKVLDQLAKHVDTTFAPRDCQALVSGESP